MVGIILCFIKESQGMSRYKKLNAAIVDIVQDYSLVSFVPLMIEVRFRRKKEKCSNSSRTLLVLSQGIGSFDKNAFSVREFNENWYPVNHEIKVFS